MADTHEIEWRMSDVQRELDVLQHRGWYTDMPRCAQLYDELLELERQLARVQRKEYAQPVPWPLGEFKGTGDPFLLQTGLDCALGYRTRDGNPGEFALITFPLSMGAKMVRVNDEVLSGHPLYGRGLRAYGCFECVGSSWGAALRSNHSVHPQFQPAYWETLRHYLFCFNDSMVDVVAPRWEPVGVFPSAELAWEEAVRTVHLR